MLTVEDGTQHDPRTMLAELQLLQEQTLGWVKNDGRDDRCQGVDCP
jgi:hypothetical protein